MTIVPDEEIALRLMVLSARVTRIVRRHGPSDTIATWRALSILSEHESMRLGEFADLDQLSQPAATAKMNRLVGEGLVERRPDEHDRRAVRFRLTPAGHERLATLRRAGLTSVLPGIGQLDAEQRAQLAGALDVVAELLDRSAEGEHTHAQHH